MGRSDTMYLIKLQIYVIKYTSKKQFTIFFMHISLHVEPATFLYTVAGTQQPHAIQCLAIQGKIVFATYKNVIKAFKRGQEVNSYVSHEGEVQLILPFGEHLVSIDDKNVLKIWHSKSRGTQACQCYCVGLLYS